MPELPRNGHGIGGAAVTAQGIQPDVPPVGPAAPPDTFGRLGAGEPSPARIYSYWLGGRDYRDADRDVAESVIRRRGQIVAAAHANRAFLRRVVWYAASGRGIRQFLDIGAGLPGPALATHEVAQRANRRCRVVYADSDAYVVSRSREACEAPGCGPCAHVQADVRDPAALLAAASGALDFTQPVAVLLLAVLDHLPDEDDPPGIVAELAGALAPGSLLAISHLTGDHAPAEVSAAVAVWNARVVPGLHPRSGSEVLALFGGLPLQWPGVVPVTRWLPAFADAPGRTVDICGGLAQVPLRRSRDSGAATLPACAAADIAAGDQQPGEALQAVVGQNPGFRIWEDTSGDRVRYVAKGRTLTLVSDSLGEISEALAERRDNS
jgi:SAM-dependent methyltransferase